MMLYHNDDRKRSCDTIAAFKLVKEKIPSLKVLVFGVPKRPDDLPEWFEYHRLPEPTEHRNLYNNAEIFCSASKAEGMALPPGEAMICGCALVCTDIGGHRVYAEPEKTALLSPVFNVEALSQNIIRLIENPSLRISIAKAGNEKMKQFTMESASKKFLEALEENHV